MVCLLSRILPCPLHVSHDFISVPSFAPEPLHALHGLFFVSTTVRDTPNTDSSNESSISIETSRPRCWRCRPPPKISPKLPKMSPISNSTCWPLKPLCACAKSCQLNPPAPACAPPANAWPYASYSARFFSSPKTVYASLISLNFASSPVFLSGWYVLASDRNAFLMSWV